MAELSLKALTKVYPGKVTAVSDINVEIADGEFIVLVGPSGCGKSTLLRMIAGLETITEGELTIANRVVNKIEPGERDIAMVFQNYALYPHMSVRQNMAYGLKNEGLLKAQIAERIAEASQILQLDPYLERRPRQLSGGQRQRVAMGRAIVRHPSVFLFDEPLSNLDAKLRTQLRAELKNLHKRLSGTFIYVTHDQVEAMSLADRVVVMNAGHVEQIGTPLEIYRRPASVFVAGFIGNPTMNLLEGRVTDGTLTVNEAPIALGRTDIPPGRYTIGIRPENVYPTRADEARATLRTDYIEQLGADTIVHGRLGETGFTLRQDGQFSLPESGEMAISFDPDAVHVFDSTTGHRIDP